MSTLATSFSGSLPQLLQSKILMWYVPKIKLWTLYINIQLYTAVFFQAERVHEALFYRSEKVPVVKQNCLSSLLVPLIPIPHIPYSLLFSSPSSSFFLSYPSPSLFFFSNSVFTLSLPSPPIVFPLSFLSFPLSLLPISQPHAAVAKKNYKYFACITVLIVPYCERLLTVLWSLYY